MEVEEIENIISEYGHVIYKFCIKLTQSKEDGEDLYQHTFLKAMELRHKLDKNNSPRTFLIAVAIKTWKNSVRKHNRREFITRSIHVDAEELWEVKDSSVNTEKEIIQKETMNEVNLVVERLEDKFRLPVIMLYTLEMPVEEIAKALKIPTGTVKSRLHKARKIIRKELEGMGYEGV